VRFVHHATKSLLADVGVALGGGQIGVTQELLHRPQIGPVVEQMGGEGVPKGVGMGGVSRLPRRFKNSASWGDAGPARAARTPSHARTAWALGTLMGTTRCLDPLPHTRTVRAVKSRSSGPSEHSSLTRRPLP
jgi:hypothetical protein